MTILATLLSAVAVSLGQAESPPTYLTYLWPGGHVTYARGHDGHNCPTGGFFTDTSAYRWNGDALGAQRWNRDHTLTYWRGYRGSVTFDGITFTNSTKAKVLVAGWCDTGRSKR